jgi:hypothetical protein
MSRSALFAMIFALAIGDARLLAQDSPPSAESANAVRVGSRRGNPDARRIVRDFAEFYRRCGRIEVRCELVETERWPIEKVLHPNAATYSITADRPNRLAMQGNWEAFQFGIVCDGKTLSTSAGPPLSPRARSNPVPNQYWQSEAPPSLAEIVENRLSMGSMGWPDQPLVLRLLTDDPYEDLMDGVKAVSYAGEETLGGIRVHRVRFARDVFSWEAWIAAEGEPVLQKAVIDTTDAVMFATAERGKVSARITQRFKEWRFNHASKPDAFVFAPHPGATKADAAFGVVSINAALPKTDRLAPNVQLDLCDGGKIKLGSHAGKEIVVLVCASQFFNPFRNAAWSLRHIAERYRNKGVVVYLVNTEPGVEEDFARLEARQKTFAGVVALDGRHEVAKAFGLDPTSSDAEFVTIVDQQGVVQAVHDAVFVGKAQLRRELDSLLAGKSLLPNAPNREAKTGRPSE